MSARNTRALLLDQTRRYPLSQLQDHLKFLFQSSFGCEHLVGDPSAAAEYIRKEAAQARPHPGEITESLDGPFFRVHLDILSRGLTPETLARLFAWSARKQDQGEEALKTKLEVLTDMIRTGELPLDPGEAEKTLRSWEREGFPPCRHSETFREAYAPAYRLLHREAVSFLPLFCAVDRRLARSERLTLVIDGMCASGKSTLAALLGEIYGCPVLHMDDFFLRPVQRTPERYAEPGGNVDRERFALEVLQPLEKGEAFSYRPYDCRTGTLTDPVPVLPGRLTVIEGAYSLHPALRRPGQLSVFLRTPPEEQARRIRTRNGEDMAKVFAEKWIPLEQKYFDALKPEEACGLVFET